jgi:phosphoribosylglycinamide formyltransferase 1
VVQSSSEKSGLKIGILISGRGSNMQAVLNATERGVIQSGISVVISSKESAPGLAIAKSYGVPTVVVSHEKGMDLSTYESQILDVLESHQIDLLVLAGYMKIMGPTLLDRYPDRIINIHPSLLPAFKGLNAQKQALDYGVKIAGCSVHFVIPELDSGPVILQAAVPVLPDDTEATLGGRILKEEHALLPKAIALIESGAIELVNGKVIIKKNMASNAH